MSRKTPRALSATHGPLKQDAKNLGSAFVIPRFLKRKWLK